MSQVAIGKQHCLKRQTVGTIFRRKKRQTASLTISLRLGLHARSHNAGTNDPENCEESAQQELVNELKKLRRSAVCENAFDWSFCRHAVVRRT